MSTHENNDMDAHTHKYMNGSKPKSLYCMCVISKCQNCTPVFIRADLKHTVNLHFQKFVKDILPQDSFKQHSAALSYLCHVIFKSRVVFPVLFMSIKKSRRCSEATLKNNDIDNI